MYPPPPDYPDYPSYPPPGYPGYGPPPGYPPPGYGPPGHPPGYPPYSGYPPPGYGPPVYPPGYGAPPYGAPPYGVPRYEAPALQPGVIPLRPLSLSDIYNGAVSYIRANPKVTLGLSAIIVITTSIITLISRVGPLAVINQLGTDASSYELSGRDVVVWGSSVAAGAIITSLGTIVLVGMLTVVIGRAIFGSPITADEAWAMVRGRFPALLGFAALLAAGATVLIGVLVLLMAVAIANGAGFVIGMPLILALGAVLAYLYVSTSFAPTIIVLERRGVFAAVARSFSLISNSFWRVAGILLLTSVVTYLVTSAVALPFNLVAIALGDSTQDLTTLSLPGVLTGIGTTIGQIIALPFTAGVVVLLYTDRRIRAEAFDLVLRSGATGGPPPGWSTDSLWLTRPLA